jgi:hypothetical protein
MAQHKKLYQRVKVEEAVGLELAHDITEIRPGEFKGPSFRKGHRVEEKDICHLLRLGKRHLYILNLDEGQVHEDDAVFELANALCGPGIVFSRTPKEGKLQLMAEHRGLLKVAVESLTKFNMIPEVMCASIHNNTPVTKGQPIAGTRAIPLVIERTALDKAIDIVRLDSPVFTVKKFKKVTTRLVITGNEVFEGLIEDRFEDIVRDKIESFGSTLAETVVLPDDINLIADTVKSFFNNGTDIIITTGGMSVDPDDVTRIGIKKAGVKEIYYSAAALPGAMFQLAYKDNIPIVGIPACALHHKVTVFDLILPRLLAGEKPDNKDMARLSHGGFCNDCAVCHYPTCSFGKTY